MGRVWPIVCRLRHMADWPNLRWDPPLFTHSSSSEHSQWRPPDNEWRPAELKICNMITVALSPPPYRMVAFSRFTYIEKPLLSTPYCLILYAPQPIFSPPTNPSPTCRRLITTQARVILHLLAPLSAITTAQSGIISCLNDTCRKGGCLLT